MLRNASEVGSTANTYAVLAKLATGGMAEIFLARTESAAGVERYVVLKRILDHRSTDIKFVNMFLDEARLASQLQHPNIAQVYDTGKLGDSYFFTMEYVHGETVRELLHRAYAAGLHVPIACVLTIIAGSAAGLQHAHERIGFDGTSLGIVHRDISPSNLMISYEGHIKVVDFGVAKATHRSIETQSGSVKGKIGYMSPEQCRGGIVDQRCDLFSLGIVMWELLVGERLFKRATDFESMEAIVDEVSPAPSTRRIDIPPQLDALVLKLLEKHPDDRFQSADELLEAIEQLAVSTATPLSIPGLRRFVRELFGQRPEPWVEIRAREASADVVTVTGAPVASAIEMLGVLAVNKQLARIVDLSSHSEIELPDMTQSTRKLGKGRISPHAIAELTGPTRTNTHLAVGSGGMPKPAAPAPQEVTPVPRRWGWPWMVGGVIAVFGITLGALYASAPAPDGAATAVAPVRLAAVAVDAAPVATVDASAPPDPPVSVTARYEAAHYTEVIATCAGDPAIVRTNAEICALAACREHELDKARRWLQRLPVARQPGVITSCHGFGTLIVKRAPARVGPIVHSIKEPPPPKPKCDESDPMACRR